MQKLIRFCKKWVEGIAINKFTFSYFYSHILYLFLFRERKRYEKQINFYFNLAVLGLRCCLQVFSGYGERGYSLVPALRPLTGVPSHVGAQALGWAAFRSAVHGSTAVAPMLWSTGSVVVAHGLQRRQWHPLQRSFLEHPMDGGAWSAAVHGVAKSQTGLSDFTLPFHFHALEKEMATHSSVHAWRIPGTGSLVGCRLWGRTESDMTEAT